MCVCDLDKENGIPINAMKIGEFKNNIPIYACRDSRKTDCSNYVEYKNGFIGKLSICGLMTNMKYLYSDTD